MRDTEMPVAVSPARAEVVPMDIDENPEVKYDIKMPDFTKLNGHFECKESLENNTKTNTGLEESKVKFDVFASSEKIAAGKYQKLNVQVYSDLKETAIYCKGIVKSCETYTSEIKAFLKKNNFLFQTPVNSLKAHPQFSTLYNGAINDSIKKVTTSPKQNDAVTKAVPDGLEVLSVVKTKTNLPPDGEFKRPELVPGMKVYVMHISKIREFATGTIQSIREHLPDKLYKVKLENVKPFVLKLFSAKLLAYTTTPDVIVPVGTRVCARYSDEKGSAVFAGIIAEPPKITNNERYLIFFDDGYAQYIHHQDIFAMCAQSNDVADDVHDNLKEFIKAYLQKYPERPMVKLQVNQSTKTEYECNWWDTKVLDIDASMVKMYFIDSHRSEWIYRGSTRLKLLFDELNNAEEHRRAGKNRRHNIVPRKPHQPYVEYTREEEVVTLDSDDDDTEEYQGKQHLHPRRKTGGSQYLKEKLARNTARKSTSSQKPRSAICNVPLKYRTPDIKSHLGYKEIHCMVSFERSEYKPHVCSSLCREKDNPAKLKGRNPLLIPIYLGWERQVRKYRKKKNLNRVRIVYRAPCGRHCHSLLQIQHYLALTNSQLSIDFFSIEPMLLVFRTFRAKEVLYEVKDVTQGKENVPVGCVNSWSDEPPPFVEYESQRFPGKNVNLNLDPNYLCGCSCIDNCQDAENCECHQISSYAKSGNKGEVVGYKFRRLKEPIITGIYECNERCKCGPQCGNRVVQNGLQVRLQMFKTERKGWGIRCLDDLDAGQFICIYAGQLLTDQGADEDGNQFGDEYLAELDHIEVAEKTKEGYESDVSDIENNDENGEMSDKNENKSEDSEDDPNDPDASFSSDENDSDFEPNLRTSAITCLSTRGSKKAKLTSSNSSVNGDSESDTAISKKGLPDLSAPNVTNGKSVAKKSLNAKTNQMKITRKENKFRSTRNFYNEESCYIMDAKSKGNIGRYLNHSCAPNVFVQNVFTDTHDLRFPAIAFFAMHYILAGTELTWDYNYEVGSVVDKVMYCYCDSGTCRGRLL